MNRTRKYTQQLPQLISDFTSVYKLSLRPECGHDDNSGWHFVSRKTALLFCYCFTISKETNAYSFWATRLIKVLKEAEWSALLKYYEFFFKFFDLKKVQPPEFEIFYEKMIFFKHVITRKRKLNTEIRYIILQSKQFLFEWYKKTTL